MSRTVKGSKAPGYEYWSRRPNKGARGGVGRFTKRKTHRAERQQGKRETRCPVDE